MTNYHQGYYQQQPPPVAISPGGWPLASFGARLGAHLIDAGVILLIGVGSLLIIGGGLAVLAENLGPQLINNSSDTGPAPWFIVLLVLLYFGWGIGLNVGYYFYYVRAHVLRGRTFGKRLVGLRVTPIDPRLTLDKRMAQRRYVVHILAGFVAGFSLLDGLWQLWDKPWQQTLHDKFAQTVVIKISA